MCRSSQYFPPTRLSYYSSGPVYPFIGPVLPSAALPYPYSPSPPYYQPRPQPRPDLLEDRVDAASLSVVSLLPSLLRSVVVPVLAAGSAVWLSQNLPTPVVQERRKRSSGGARGTGNVQGEDQFPNIPFFSRKIPGSFEDLEGNQLKTRLYR